MQSIQYDKNKTLISNVLNLFKYANWLYREMLQGRVAVNREQGEKNAEDLIKAEQNCTDLDIQNIIIGQQATDLDIRLTILEKE